MSQYFMYGMYVPENKMGIIGNVSFDINADCLFTGRDGKFLILGKVISTYDKFEAGKPIEIPLLTAIEENDVELHIKEKYNITGYFHYYFIIK